jgi:hypothetical protein
MGGSILGIPIKCGGNLDILQGTSKLSCKYAFDEEETNMYDGTWVCKYYPNGNFNGYVKQMSTW